MVTDLSRERRQLEETGWRRKQRLERCPHEPREASGPWKLEKAEKGFFTGNF